MPLPIVAGLGVVGGLIAKTLSVETVKFIATRALLYGLFTLVLPVVIYNVLTRIMSEMMDYVASQSGSVSTDGYMIQLTGMAGWIANELSLVTCFSMVLSAYALRFVISIIKR